MIKESTLIGTKVPAPWGWREFKVGDLFQVIVGNRQNMSSSGKYPLIKAKTGDNGYAGFADNYDLAFGLTIGMRGSFNVYVQNSPVALGTNTAGLILKDSDASNTQVLLYLGTMLHRENYEGSSGYVGYPTLKRLTQIDTMRLPVTQDGQPDYGWMSSYIRELENQRIRELETYLQVTGLDDMTLTDNELQVLEQWRQHEKFGGTLLTKRFAPLELFKVYRGTRITTSNRVIGDVPLVTAGSENMGITEYIDNPEQTLFNDTIDVSLTIDMFGNCFTRDYEFNADDNILVLQNNALNLQHMLFINSVFQKALHSQFNYGSQFRLHSLDALTIELPVTNNGTPDYDFMQTFIKAQEKLLMQRLDKFRQLQINTTKAVI